MIFSGHFWIPKGFPSAKMDLKCTDKSQYSVTTFYGGPSGPHFRRFFVTYGVLPSSIFDVLGSFLDVFPTLFGYFWPAFSALFPAYFGTERGR